MASTKKSAALTGNASAADGAYLGARMSPHYCAMRLQPPRAMPPGVTGNRAKLIALLANKWMNGSTQHIAEDDDSGHERNAELKATLKKGQRIHVKVRIRYVAKAGEAALMVW